MGGAIHLSPVLQSENEIGSKPTSRSAVLPVSDHAGRVDFNGCFLKVLRNFCHKIDQITFCNSHLHSGRQDFGLGLGWLPHRIQSSKSVLLIWGHKAQSLLN